MLWMLKFGLRVMKNKLSSLINPRSVALIGATERSGSVGSGLVENLWSGRHKRKLFWVNPNLKEIKGERTYHSILEITEPIDLAVVAVPAEVVPQVVQEAVSKKVGSIIVISAGFAETDSAGRQRQDEIINLTRRSGIPLLGPNCLGLLRPPIELNASFAPFNPPSGGIAFISQSGALMNSVIDRSGLENYGFSLLISYGNGADVSLVDLLWLADRDQSTKVIAIYLEGLDEGREFMEVAREISSRKPIIVLKAGRTELGQRAASSHTASLAGSDQVYQAAFKQSGVFSASSLEELFDWAKALEWLPRIENGLAILTNGGGMGVLATDQAVDQGLLMPELSEATRNRLQKSDSFAEETTFKNPLDIIGDADTERYRQAIEALLTQSDVHALVVIQTKQTMTNIQENMEVIAQAAQRWPKKALISVCLPGRLSQMGIKWLEEQRIPNYSDPVRALRAARVLTN